MSAQAPPADDGLRLACLERGEDEQLRITWAEYKGRPYVSLQVWTQDRRGRWWPDRRRSVSIRIRELTRVSKAIFEAMNIADELRAGWSPRPETSDGSAG